MKSNRAVLLPDEIVPFFIHKTFDDSRLFEVVQIRLCEADSETMTNNLITELALPKQYKAHILSIIDEELKEYKKLLELYPATEWAIEGSAVHIMQVEASTESVIYSDQFDWDIFNETVSPDDFARLTISELGLPGEFVNLLSAEIRHQVIRLRSMHAFPERFLEYIKDHPLSIPQTARGFRPVTDLLDVSPVVGLKPGRELKNSTSSRERDRRAQRRHNKTTQADVLHPITDGGVVQVVLVPIVRAVPMPEDSPLIDLSAVPQLFNSEETIREEDISKIRSRLEQAKFCPNQQSGDESDEDSGNDNI